MDAKSLEAGYSNNFLLRKLKGYYELMKPRVMSLVIFTAFVGMFLAPGQITFLKSFLVIVAIALGAGSSAAINMWFDEDIDKTMERTKLRPIPLGIVSKNEALVVGIFTGTISLILMQWFSNSLATSLLLFTILFYVFVLQNDVLISDIVLDSKNAFKTIGILSIFFIGEYILINNVISQNIAREPHILTARALGYSKLKIYNKNILRNSFGPFATRLTLGLPYTIASLVIVESTTGWNGMGSVLYQSIMNQDSNAAMGLFLLLALLTAFLRISISVVQVVFDPRVRLR